MTDLTANWGRPSPTSSEAPNGPAQIKALADSLDDCPPFTYGLASARPVSTGGSPGKVNRFYFSTDTGALERDTGTSWVNVAAAAQAAAIAASQPLDADLTALAALATDPFGLALLTKATAAAIRTYIGTVIGTDVQAHDSDLDLYAAAAGPGAQLGLNDGTTVRRGKSIIATSESRTNAAYGLLTTPDRVQNVVLPTDGLLYVAYQATWQESVNGAARAAIFIGANQLKGPVASGVALAALDSGTHGFDVNSDAMLGSFPGGLTGSPGASGAYAGDATTGQLVGGFAGGSPSDGTGFATIFAAAGTYDISVQFKASSGSVTAKNRKLWVWTLGF